MTLSPPNDLKCAYVEVVNPMISRRITEVAHRLPDSMRHHRESLRALRAAIEPEIPFAENSAIVKPSESLEDDGLRAEIKRGLSSTSADRIFSDEARRIIAAGLERMRAAPRRGGVRATVKRVVPQRVIRQVKPLPTLRLSGAQLAFRAYIAGQIAEILGNDAPALEASPANG